MGQNAFSADFRVDSRQLARKNSGKTKPAWRMVEISRGWWRERECRVNFALSLHKSAQTKAILSPKVVCCGDLPCTVAYGGKSTQQQAGGRTRANPPSQWRTVGRTPSRHLRLYNKEAKLHENRAQRRHQHKNPPKSSPESADFALIFPRFAEFFPCIIPEIVI